jgi:hypothetical protein
MEHRGFAGFDITDAKTNITDIPSIYGERLLAPLCRGPFLEAVRDAALSFSLTWRKHVGQINQRNAAMVESILAITGASIVIDSSKLALRLKYLLRIPFLEIRVIRVIRDGRAVALTYTDEWNFADASDPKLRGGGSGTRRAPPRRSMAEAANEWKRSNESADCLISTLPGTHWMEVRYEELCTSPAETLRHLLSFIGLDSARVVLDFRSRKQHVLGNGMRMDSTSDIRVDERWKECLTAEDLKVFDAIGGDLNRKYGYV